MPVEKRFVVGQGVDSTERQSTLTLDNARARASCLSRQSLNLTDTNAPRNACPVCASRNLSLKYGLYCCECCDYGRIQSKISRSLILVTSMMQINGCGCKIEQK